MSFGVVLLSGLMGYLLGSLSWARILARVVAPEEDIETTEYVLPGRDETFVVDSVSATSVRFHLGPRYGCLTALLDMAKVAVPTLALRLILPQEPFYLVAAAMGVVGHNWPVFYRFKGGRGASPIMGGLLVIDPLAFAVTMVGGSLLGVIVGHFLVFRWAWLILLMPWFWFRSHSWLLVGYAFLVNAAYWVAMLPELKRYARMRTRLSQEEIGEFFGMGRSLGRFLDRYSLLGLIKRSRGDGQ